MNVEIGTEPTQFPEKAYVNGIFVAVYIRHIWLCFRSVYYFLTDKENRDYHLQCIQRLLQFNEGENQVIDRHRPLKRYWAEIYPAVQHTQFSMWFNISVDYIYCDMDERGGAVIYMSSLQSDGYFCIWTELHAESCNFVDTLKRYMSW